MVFVRAQVGLPDEGDSQELFTVQYFDEEGNVTIRSAGTRAWRCNNPGNLKKSPYSTGFETFWKAIEQVEKWRVGEEEFIEKEIIAGVHKKRGVIAEYLVRRSGKDVWIAKEQAVHFAVEGRLHAVIVHLKNGTIYLRPEYRAKPFELIS